MRFTTISGSLYEVDTTAKKIRRLNGKGDPTPRQGKDGEWQPYLNDITVEKGEPVWIQWAAPKPLTEETRDLFGIEEKDDIPTPGRVTHTSIVVEIDNNVYN